MLPREQEQHQRETVTRIPRILQTLAGSEGNPGGRELLGGAQGFLPMKVWAGHRDRPILEVFGAETPTSTRMLSDPHWPHASAQEPQAKSVLGALSCTPSSGGFLKLGEQAKPFWAKMPESPAGR